MLEKLKLAAFISAQLEKLKLAAFISAQLCYRAGYVAEDVFIESLAYHFRAALLQSRLHSMWSL